MQNYSKITPEEEAKFFILFKAECERKDKLLTEFEKLEEKERKRKNSQTKKTKKYERLKRGIFIVEKKSGDFIHLNDKNQSKVGIFHASPEVSGLIRVNDILEGSIGFRDGYWRVYFLNSITNSTNDFMT